MYVLKFKVYIIHALCYDIISTKEATCKLFHSQAKDHGKELWTTICADTVMYHNKIAVAQKGIYFEVVEKYCFMFQG